MIEQLFRTFAASLIVNGNVEIALPSGHKIIVGDGAGPPLAMTIKDRSSLVGVMRDPTLRFGELFVDGRIIVTRGTIYDILAITAQNLMRHGGSAWLKLLNRGRKLLGRLERSNAPVRAQRNVAHHYDLDGRLYDLFLDADRQYSCAYFERPDMDIEAAQRAKKRHIAAKLLIDAGHRVLDVGCGWGGLGLYLATYCGAAVDGITLSEEQLAIATRRATESGLRNPPNFVLQDYRKTTGTYDRIVSVGMFEHVGLSDYDAYFRTIADRLADDGVALVHTIGRATEPWPTNPWVKKYIFPGGYLPSLSEIMPAVEAAGLYVTDVEILRLHYAETLLAWRQRFMARRNEAVALYDERFCRMWEFYLAGSECAFRFEGTVVFQLQLAKRVDAVPLTRDYIGAREADLRVIDTPAPPELRLAGE
jgi:cyclopropane-fatty-acyl-phospholipid synthase